MVISSYLQKLVRADYWICAASCTRNITLLTSYTKHTLPIW